jgi:peptidylprolyl isomerase
VIAASLLSGSGTADSTQAGSAAQPATAASNATGPYGESSEAPGKSSGAGKAEPRVPSPKGPPATSLEVEDLVVGSGPEAKKGQEVEVHYVLFLRKSGKKIDSSWKRGEPYSFELGSGKVTAGWERGIEGMKAGGRREIVAPGSLSYGKKGQPPTIGPNETLVSVIDLLAVK